MAGQYYTFEGLKNLGQVLSGAIIPTVHLLQGPIPNNTTLAFSVLVEADYDGYAPQPVAGAPVINTPSPRRYTVYQWQRQLYQPTDYTVGNTITGHCLTYTPSGTSTPVVLATETYQSPIPLLQDGDELTLNPVLSLPFDVTAGVASPGVP